MKTLDLKLIFSILLMLSLTVGCKKDALVKSDIRDTEQSTDPDDDDSIHAFIDGDIRVSKVQFHGKSYRYDHGMKEYNYHYDESGVLKSVLQDKVNAVMDELEITFGNGEIIFDTKEVHGWHKSKINYLNDRIDSVTVWTKFPNDNYASVEGVVHFNTEGNKLQSVNINNSMLSRVAAYQPLKSSISSYNSYGLPEKTKSIYIKSWVPPVDASFEFTFEYVEADGIPSKLKRLVNEELLHLNKYGVTNMDIHTIYFEKENRSYYGESNWLVSFGLPQYYILEEKSTHLVSKRTTDIYKINEAGEKEYERTITEDFPYVHDAKARTLEIAGLKIWYEYVE